VTRDPDASNQASTVEAVPVVEETTNDGQAEKALGDGELMVDQDLAGACFSTTLSIEPSNPVPLRTSQTELQYV
jgi:glucose-6-phosphate dehydrogenase assembly protein OpcA